MVNIKCMKFRLKFFLREEFLIYERVFNQRGLKLERICRPWEELGASPYTGNIEQVILTNCLMDDQDMTLLFHDPKSNFHNLVYVNLQQCRNITEASILGLI